MEAQEPADDALPAPKLPRLSTQKVPGGWDESPAKPTADQHFGANGEHFKLNQQVDMASLPQLPSSHDSSSFLDVRSNGEGGSDTLDEDAMNRHLSDVESSFEKAPSPIGAAKDPGADDTYVFDASIRHKPAGPTKKDGGNGGNGASQGDPSHSPPTPAETYYTPGPTAPSSNHAGEDATEEGFPFDANTTASLETMSSPAAAAAFRSNSRNIPSARLDYGMPPTSAPRQSLQDDLEQEATPRPTKTKDLSPSALDESDRSTAHQNQSPQRNGHLAAFNGDSTVFLHRQTSSNRPGHLRTRTRYPSQRSSTSSFVSNSSVHDSGATLGADYALQTGGALPSGGLPASSSNNSLARSISLGSIASGFDEHENAEPPHPIDTSLKALAEERRSSEDTGVPVTPTQNPHLDLPTDTVIAQRVHNVQVPDSVAHRYLDQNRLDSFDRSAAPSALSMARSGRNMTLKEQSNTIERLSKENFDLKLKVMFLGDTLSKRSEEGVTEIINENVGLKSAVAAFQRENKALRKKVRELEKKNKEDEDRPGTGHSSSDGGPRFFETEEIRARDEQIVHLNETIRTHMSTIEDLRHKHATSEAQTRKLAEDLLASKRRLGEDVGARETEQAWQDLLDQEIIRREAVDEENRNLKEELARMRSGSPYSSNPGDRHTTNIYNMSRKRDESSSRPRTGDSARSGRSDRHQGTSASSATLVEENEQLRHENDELRREIGVQQSMLASRQREKDRLYTEIEELKLGKGRRGSNTGDSILDRSASRAGAANQTRMRPRGAGGYAASQANSFSPTQSVLEDYDREYYEAKHDQLRDRYNKLTLRNQEVEGDHRDLLANFNALQDELENTLEKCLDSERVAAELQDELNGALGDLQIMQKDRNEALKGQEQLEAEFEGLRKEAQDEIDAIDSELQEKQMELDRLETELANSNENFEALQSEMRAVSEAVIKLEDEVESKQRRILHLEQQVDEANRELEELDQDVADNNAKIDRLNVEQESRQAEIAFLREEQEADKQRISDLENTLKTTESDLQEETRRSQELEQMLVEERRQRDLVATKEKQEVQKIINDLNRELSGARDESRDLRKNLSSQETEASEWKSRYFDLEQNIREALGEVRGTKASYCHRIMRLLKEHEQALNDLDAKTDAVAEKERIIKNRDALLESHALEVRRLSDMIDRERQSHRNTKHQLEQLSRTSETSIRTTTQMETRYHDEKAKHLQAVKRLTALENDFKDQLVQRNNLLLVIWNHLAEVCGKDWAHDNSLINGRALPSIESVSSMLPGFSKNLMNAIKTIESKIHSFTTSIRAMEHEYNKQVAALESALESRAKRLERQENLTRNPDFNYDRSGEIARLTKTIERLKGDLTRVGRNIGAPGNYQEGGLSPINAHSPAPSVPTGPRNNRIHETASRTTTLTRHNATSVETTSGQRSGSSGSYRTPDKRTCSSMGPRNPDERKEEVWLLRLKEMEQQITAEREGRRADREGARKRLLEGERREGELKAELEREKMRAQIDGR